MFRQRERVWILFVLEERLRRERERERDGHAVRFTTNSSLIISVHVRSECSECSEVSDFQSMDVSFSVRQWQPGKTN